jgi:hypothetical protein
MNKTGENPNICITCGNRFHCRLQEPNQEAIFSFVSSSPAKIAKRREWGDPQLRRRFAFAAYRTARLGALTLYLADELFPGGGYRETCEQAARIRLEDDLAARWQWPFDGEPPFKLWDPNL